METMLTPCNNPCRYLITSIRKISFKCMIDIDEDFVNRVKAGDIMVANKNFGCGSSREDAPIAIKASGISCIIAETFARIFYRNSINIGLPIIECPEAAREIKANDEVEVDFDTGIISNITSGKKYQGQAFQIHARHYKSRRPNNNINEGKSRSNCRKQRQARRQDNFCNED